MNSHWIKPYKIGSICSIFRDKIEAQKSRNFPRDINGQMCYRTWGPVVGSACLVSAVDYDLVLFGSYLGHILHFLGGGVNRFIQYLPNSDVAWKKIFLQTVLLFKVKGILLLSKTAEVVAVPTNWDGCPFHWAVLSGDLGNLSTWAKNTKEEAKWIGFLIVDTKGKYRKIDGSILIVKVKEFISFCRMNHVDGGRLYSFL